MEVFSGTWAWSRSLSVRPNCDEAGDLLCPSINTKLLRGASLQLATATGRWTVFCIHLQHRPVPRFCLWEWGMFLFQTYSGLWGLWVTVIWNLFVFGLTAIDVDHDVYVPVKFDPSSSSRRTETWWGYCTVSYSNSKSKFVPLSWTYQTDSYSPGFSNYAEFIWVGRRTTWMETYMNTSSLITLQYVRESRDSDSRILTYSWHSLHSAARNENCMEIKHECVFEPEIDSSNQSSLGRWKGMLPSHGMMAQPCGIGWSPMVPVIDKPHR